MRMHTVTIYRNTETQEWQHRFVTNGRELVRQSEGTKRRDTAIRSATIAYDLGSLTPTGRTVTKDGVEYAVHMASRVDVRVRIEETR